MGDETASICAAYVVLVDAVGKLPAVFPTPKGKTMPAEAGTPVQAKFDPAFYDPKGAIVDQLAAVSVGVIDGEVRLDLDYQDDSRALVDMNVAYTGSGKFVEIQGSAENGGGFDRKLTDQMLDLAVRGCEELMRVQRSA